MTPRRPMIVSERGDPWPWCHGSPRAGHERGAAGRAGLDLGERGGERGSAWPTGHEPGPIHDPRAMDTDAFAQVKALLGSGCLGFKGRADRCRPISRAAPAGAAPIRIPSIANRIRTTCTRDPCPPLYEPDRLPHAATTRADLRGPDAAWAPRRASTAFRGRWVRGARPADPGPSGGRRRAPRFHRASGRPLGAARGPAPPRPPTPRCSHPAAPAAPARPSAGPRAASSCPRRQNRARQPPGRPAGTDVYAVRSGRGAVRLREHAVTVQGAGTPRRPDRRSSRRHPRPRPGPTGSAPRRRSRRGALLIGR